MAASYPSTALQAKQGAEANSEIADIYDNGLNAEKTIFANNDNNEVTITQSGIICKRMDNEGFYDGKQLRITGNVMAFTDDDWKTVKMAIGEKTFYNPYTKQEETKYGIYAPALVGELIAGDNMFIGNEENNVVITGDGIDIMNGSLCIANDDYSIEIDPNHRLGRLKNLQDETLNNILNNIRDDFLFCIRDKNIKIDENTPIEKKNDDIIIGIDTEGDGYFKGNVNATSITAKEQYYVNSGGNEIPLIGGKLNPVGLRWLTKINIDGRGITLQERYDTWFDPNINSNRRKINATIDADNIIILGEKTHFKGDIYTNSSEITTSDRNLKDNIKSLTEKHIKFFSLLQPVLFTFKDGTSGRTHIGFISQDVEEAMYKAGLTDLDFAGFCKRTKTITETDSEGFKTELPDLDENGNVQYIYSLRYDEFIALNTYIIQHTIGKVEKLEQENKDLKQRVEKIEKMLY